MIPRATVFELNAGSLKNRFLVGCVVLCILLNGFVPRFSIQKSDYAVLEQIFESQSILIQFFSFSTLPLTIVNDLFSGPVSVGDTKKKPVESDSNSANTSADYSIVNLEKRITSLRSQFMRTMPVIGDSSLVGALPTAPPILDTLTIPISPHPLVFLILLAFLFLLPRSSIPDADDLIIDAKSHHSARLDRSSWVFYLLKTTTLFSRSLS